MVVRPITDQSVTMGHNIPQKLTLIVLIIGVLMIIALTVSIALLFTIGKPKSETATDTSYNFEPCDCGCPAINPQITPRVVNGEAAIPNSWPWQLLLVVFTYEGVPYSYCGASLISPKHVLTAAHCVFGWSPRYVGVIARNHQFNISLWTRDRAYMAERIYVHESYDDTTLNDDIAVVRLITSVALDETANLICLAPENMRDQDLKEGDQLVATGWGALESYNRSRPSVLQQVQLQYVSSTHPLCSSLISANGKPRPGQMCAGFPPRAVCFGDSGGPLIRSIVHPNGKTYWQQVGVVSGTVDCGYRTNYSDVYARVSYYNPWIMNKMRIST